MLSARVRPHRGERGTGRPDLGQVLAGIHPYPGRPETPSARSTLSHGRTSTVEHAFSRRCMSEFQKLYENASGRETALSSSSLSHRVHTSYSSVSSVTLLQVPFLSSGPEARSSCSSVSHGTGAPHRRGSCWSAGTTGSAGVFLSFGLAGSGRRIASFNLSLSHGSCSPLHLAQIATQLRTPATSHNAKQSSDPTFISYTHYSSMSCTTSAAGRPCPVPAVPRSQPACPRPDVQATA